MSDDTLLQAASAILTSWARETRTPEPGRLDIILEAGDLPAAVAALCDARWGYLSAITGLDLGAAAGAIELLYHVCSGPAVLTLRVRVPRDAPAVPSICGVIASASFLEREIGEMFGVSVVGTPDPRRLYTSDDWPEGVYPMRKDFVPS